MQSGATAILSFLAIWGVVFLVMLYSVSLLDAEARGSLQASREACHDFLLNAPLRPCRMRTRL
jgi:hypothetical protein